MQRATWNWSKTGMKESLSNPRETKKDSSKRKEQEQREDKLRCSSLLRACKRLTLTTSFWMQINEMLFKAMVKTLTT